MTTCRTSIPTSTSTKKRWRLSPDSVRVLGVDCGSQRTGYGVVESDGCTHTLVSAGVISTDASQLFEQRLAEIARGLRGVIERHSPACAAVEQVFFAANVRSALKLAH